MPWLASQRCKEASVFRGSCTQLTPNTSNDFKRSKSGALNFSEASACRGQTIMQMRETWGREAIDVCEPCRPRTIGDRDMGDHGLAELRRPHGYWWHLKTAARFQQPVASKACCGYAPAPQDRLCRRLRALLTRAKLKRLRTESFSTRARNVRRGLAESLLSKRSRRRPPFSRGPHKGTTASGGIRRPGPAWAWLQRSASRCGASHPLLLSGRGSTTGGSLRNGRNGRSALRC